MRNGKGKKDSNEVCGMVKVIKDAFFKSSLFVRDRQTDSQTDRQRQRERERERERKNTKIQR